ncbi:MAG: OmpA family protein [Polyangiaceae bacterium]|nr:OmpA family protein [Polyangiaceae bacterium]
MRRPVPHWFAVFAVLPLLAPLAGCSGPAVVEPPKVADTGNVAPPQGDTQNREVMIAAPAVEPQPARTPPERTATDRDGDGLSDAVDLCPDDPEDMDGFQDEDGCPDPDNDADGIADVTDKCPNVPEDKNRVEDDDGCPEGSPSAAIASAWPDSLDLGLGVRFVKGQSFDFTIPIAFKLNASTMNDQSLAMVERIAGFLLARGKSLTVEVGVHSDSLGSDDRNKQLTQDRADEIRRLLMKAGVAGSRVKAVGYGETKPIVSNDSAENRAKNRRVEIRVIGS